MAIDRKTIGSWTRGQLRKFLDKLVVGTGQTTGLSGWIDGGTNTTTGRNVGIGTTSPQNPLDIYEVGGLVIAATVLDPQPDFATTSNFTQSYTLVNSGAKVSFTVPASGKIEIQTQIFVVADAPTSPFLYLSLSSTAAPYAEYLNAARVLHQPHTQDDATVNMSWYFSGLTPGDEDTLWLFAKSSVLDSMHATWGGQFPSLIMKVISMPNTVSREIS